MLTFSIFFNRLCFCSVSEDHSEELYSATGLKVVDAGVGKGVSKMLMLTFRLVSDIFVNVLLQQ